MSHGKVNIPGPLGRDVSAFLSSFKAAGGTTDFERLLSVSNASSTDSKAKIQVNTFLCFITTDPSNRTLVKNSPSAFSAMIKQFDLAANDANKLKEVSQAFFILSSVDDPTREAIFKACSNVFDVFSKQLQSSKDPQIRENAIKFIVNMTQTQSVKDAFLKQSGESFVTGMVSVLKADKANPNIAKFALQLLSYVLNHHQSSSPSQLNAIYTCMIKNNAVELVLELLNNPNLYDQAIGVIAKMTSNADIRRIISEKGAVTIVKNLNMPTQTSQAQQITAFRNSLITLSNLCVDEKNVTKLASSDVVGKITKLLTECAKSRAGSHEAQSILLILQLMNNLTTSGSGVDQLLSSNSLQITMDFLSAPPPTIADEYSQIALLSLLAGLLTNDEIHEKFCNNKGVPILSSKLASQSTGIRREAAKGIGNVTQYFDDIRESVGTGSTLAALANMLNSSDDESKRQSLRALTNLALNYTTASEMVKYNIIKSVKSIVENNNSETVLFATKLLVNLTANDTARPVVSKEIGVNVVSRLINDNDEQRQLQGLKLITNLSIQGRNRKLLHEAREVDKIKNLRTRNPEVKHQIDIALNNLSFPYEKSYNDDGTTIATDESIVISAPEAPLPYFIHPDYEDDEDEDEFAFKKSPVTPTPSQTSPSQMSPQRPVSTNLKSLPKAGSTPNLPSTSPFSTKLQPSRGSATSLPTRTSVFTPPAKTSPTVSPSASPSKTTPRTSTFSPKSAPSTPPPLFGSKARPPSTPPSKALPERPPAPTAPLPAVPPKAKTVSSFSTSKSQPPQQSVPAAAKPAPPRPARSVMGLTEEQQQLHEKRTKIAKEILSTEVTYVNGLKILLWKFLNPLNATSNSRKPMLSSTEIKTIFSNVEVIQNYNAVLLESLQNRMLAWSATQLIGDIFLKVTDYLKCYVEYVNNYENGLHLLNKIRKEKPSFHSYLRKIESSKDCKSLPLDGFLITPVQRVPRYEMLLKDLLNNTWKGHPDYDNIAKAYSKMKETGSFINEKKRESEGLERLFYFNNRLLGAKQNTIYEASRRWVKDGKIHRLDLKTQNLKPGCLWMFNDLIILCKIKGRKKDLRYSYKAEAEMATLLVENVSSTKIANVLRFSDKAKNTAFFVAFQSAEEQKTWHQAVQQAQQQYHQRRSSFKTSATLGHLPTSV